MIIISLGMIGWEANLLSRLNLNVAHMILKSPEQAEITMQIRTELFFTSTTARKMQIVSATTIMDGRLGKDFE